ncbi:hypothetical protein IEO21_00015 [Rhodonia placenta]|uniref:NUDE domain-containing protein n=2 Tax=Rhodonia placenta TaxID=104341 RepID=A0A8H7PBV9_9APHY|nr:hypothetical protein IEO21_00015 [Postia placenta]
MTAVLQATDVLRKDKSMAAFDDNAINFTPSTDWKVKYFEVADMLAETRAELDDFHHSSKELEEELERELERTEKAQQDLKVKVARAEQERDEWKAKFMSLQTTHNTTTTSLQRELDTLRGDYQRIKIQLRELEMGNDDLERNERAIASSLADIEGKYARVLEEKILLEHELLDKANVEEESQRLKDELRDANEEINILKDQLGAAHARPTTATESGSSAPSSIVSPSTPSVSEDNLLNIPIPPDLSLTDLSAGKESPTKESPLFTTPRTAKSPGVPAYSQSPSMQRLAQHLPRTMLSTPPGGISGFSRSSTVPSLSSTPSRAPSRTPAPRPAVSRNTSSTNSSNTTGSVPMTATRSKGVQMVSEMRARVKILEQKIHTRVPRLRMGSVTSRAGANSMPPPPPPPPKAGPSSATVSPAPSTSSLRSTSHASHASYDERAAHARSRRQSIDLDSEPMRAQVGDASGWVLIMEDSPSPRKDKDKERRRTSSPTAPSSFKLPATPPHESSPSGIPRAPSAMSQSGMQSGIRRPTSRLSVSTEGRSSVSTNATSSTISSIPTPSSRPSTPTFLPIPTYGGANNGLKVSTGPGSGAYSQLKRSSLGSNPPRSPSMSSPGMHIPHVNVSVRPTSKYSVPGSMSQSRIGKPLPTGGRRSTGDADDIGGKKRDLSRARSGSNTAFLR